MIHFDLNKGNIIYSEKNNRVTIVDWEQASSGDNAMDIAKFFLKSDLNSAQQKYFLSQYESRLRENDQNFKDRLQVYKLFVLANSILWRLSILTQMSMQLTSSEYEKKFYDRVINNLDEELQTIKKYLI